MLSYLRYARRVRCSCDGCISRQLFVSVIHIVGASVAHAEKLFLWYLCSVETLPLNLQMLCAKGPRTSLVHQRCGLTRALHGKIPASNKEKNVQQRRIAAACVAVSPTNSVAPGASRLLEPLPRPGAKQTQVAPCLRFNWRGTIFLCK